MAERDVVLRISTKVGPGAGDGFKKVAEASKAAAGPVGQLEASAKRLSPALAAVGTAGASAFSKIEREARSATGQVDSLGRSLSRLGGTGGGGGGRLAGAGRAAAAGGIIAATLNDVAELGNDLANVIKLLSFGTPNTKEGVLTPAIAKLGTGLQEAGFAAVGAQTPQEAAAATEKIQKTFEAQLERQRDIRQNLTQEAQKVLGIQDKIIEAVKQESKLRTDVLKAQQEIGKEQLRQAAEATKTAAEGQQAFGALNPFQQVAFGRIGARIAAGNIGGLNPEELAFAKQQPTLAGPLGQLQQQAAGESPIFQRTAASLGQATVGQAQLRQLAVQRQQEELERQQRAEEAFIQQRTREIQAQVVQQFRITIDQTGDTVGRQIAAQILPILVAENQKARVELEKQLRDALSGIRAGTRATFGVAKQP